MAHLLIPSRRDLPLPTPRLNCRVSTTICWSTTAYSVQPACTDMLASASQGKSQQIKVTLGECKEGDQAHMARSMPPHLRSPQWFTYEKTPSDRGLQWKDFDSMTLKNLGNDRFKVEIQYLNKDGKMESHAFEGTLDEIHKSVNSEKDLPNAERDQLLRSLDLSRDTHEPLGFAVFPHTALQLVVTGLGETEMGLSQTPEASLRKVGIRPTLGAALTVRIAAVALQ